MKKHLIVAGYPKSGNTWLTRLLAELVHCPVEGFWSQPENNEIAIEGKERESDYRCFKAHHPYSQLLDSYKTYGNGSEKVIYVVRDPRDLAISAAHYFNVSDTYLRWQPLFRKLRMRRIASLLFDETNYQKVVETIVYGGKIVWMQTPWKEHVEEYLESHCLVVRYEDMVKQPIEESNRILQFLDVDCSPGHVREIVAKHSFDNRKEHFKRSGNSQAFNFLRKGQPGEWKEKLTGAQLAVITKELGPMMKKLGYL